MSKEKKLLILQFAIYEEVRPALSKHKKASTADKGIIGRLF